MDETPKKSRRRLPPGIQRIKLSDGRYRYRASIPKGTSGQRKWTRLCDDPDEAYRQRQATLKTVEDLPPGRISVENAIAHVVARLKSAGRRPGTLSWFDKNAEQIKKHFGAATALDGVTRSDVEAFRDGMVKRGLSASSIGHVRRAFSMIVRDDQNRKQLRTSPLEGVTWPAIETTRIECLRADGVRQVLARILASKNPRAEADHDLVALFYLSGLRRAEVARLRVEDVDLPGKALAVIGKRGNTRFPLTAELVEVLGRMVQRVGSGPLVPAGENHITKVFGVWRDRLDEDRLSPHKLRHAFVTGLVDAGLNVGVVQALARHQTPSMTLRYFTAGPDAAKALEALSLKEPAPPAPAAPAAAEKPARKRKPRPKGKKAAVAPLRIVS